MIIKLKTRIILLQGGGWSGLLLFGLFGSGLLSLYFYFKKQKKGNIIKINVICGLRFAIKTKCWFVFRKGRDGVWSGSSKNRRSIRTC
jgi:hypothetical protein